MHDDDDHALEWTAGTEDGEELEGIERLTLRSVGIDIGSSTTHAVFSKLTLRREGAGHSARFVVTGRAELYRSPILLTPYLSATRIDTDRVTSFVERCYGEAGFKPDEIDTGAVVITGEALKKENAQPILEHFAREGGRFICASAGPMHEALLAAHGSGAVAMSRHHRNAVLNVDIGGGTTKISVIRAGRIVKMIAVEIGARLIAYDEDMTITRIERPARTIMAALGHEVVTVGGKLSPAQREAFAERMTDVLFDIIGGGNRDPITEQLMLIDSQPDAAISDVDHVVFSGGVSEYIYGRETAAYGDIGPWLGKAVRDRSQSALKPGMLVRSAEGIRATVIGAGEYTLQASGTTSYISTPSVLPVHGIQVAHAFVTKEQSSDEVDATLMAALRKYDVTHLNGGLALAVSVAGQPDYPYLHRIAKGLVRIADPQDRGPLFVILDVDVAKSLGSILVEELRVDRPVVLVDGIEVGDLDYLDIGRPMGASEVIPITVKSLVFGMRSKSG
jgi:ethanolamine utilization protein EutA